jgi:hypothetical protein
MLATPYRRIALGVLLLAPACSPRPDPIRIRENVVIIQNQTSRDWRNVIVTVNYHFSGGTPYLAAGAQLIAPLSQFQTAFGQRYDFSRQHVFKIEVAGTDSSGEVVQLQLETGVKRR